jgi:hypothetical protein
MAAKVAHSMKIEGNAAAVVAKLDELSKLPPHKWLPIDELKTEKRATMTPRQAAWLEAQVAKKVTGSTIVFTALPAAPEQPK